MRMHRKFKSSWLLHTSMRGSTQSMSSWEHSRRCRSNTYNYSCRVRFQLQLRYSFLKIPSWIRPKRQSARGLGTERVPSKLKLSLRKHLALTLLPGGSSPEKHQHVSALPSPFGTRKPLDKQILLIPLISSMHMS